MPANHPRSEALAGVLRLLDGQTSAGQCVYLDRVDPLAADTDRAILIEPIDESYDVEEAGFDTEVRAVTVSVTGVATTAAVRDELSLEIERAMVGGAGSIHRGLSGIKFGTAADGADAFYTASHSYTVVYRIGVSTDTL